MENLETQSINEESDELITFLRLTKEGEYAEVDSNSLAYTRVYEVREDYNSGEDDNIYGISN